MAPKAGQGCNNEIGAMVKKAKHGAKSGAMVQLRKRRKGAIIKSGQLSNRQGNGAISLSWHRR
jgi:hypothetical protein